MLCSSFGSVLDIVALKTQKMRGQAHIVFSDVSDAIVALRALQGFVLFDKPMKIDFAKGKSHVIAKMDGTFRMVIARDEGLTAQNPATAHQGAKRQRDDDVENS